ncbi:MAG: glycoside hydrolase family 2 protein [Bacilli bacterium]|jgi:beta-galactosidase/beta-glucuronidase
MISLYNKRLKCPRPSLFRENFVLLNGLWGFAFDDQNKGESLNYNHGFNKQKDILVPFTFETAASLVNDQTRHDYLWYQRYLEISKNENERLLLHLEGLDYIGKIFLNGKLVGKTKGAYFRHTLEITDFVHEGRNLLVIKCEDDYSKEKLRGKQRSRDESYECFYVPTTGIYKDVWLEKVPLSYISHVRIDPHLTTKTLELEVETDNAVGKTFMVRVLSDNVLIASNETIIDKDVIKIATSLKQVTPWSPEHPFLYDLEFIIKEGGQIIDQVFSYCGFRSINAKKAKVYLNGQEFYQKLVLDQGYWKHTNLTAPNVQALEDDIKKMQAFGFNGCRKHQKIEEERFLFLADVLGFITWVEVPSAYEFSQAMMDNYMHELPHILKQNYNHPCVITWTLFNESWGIRDILTNQEIQDFTVRAYQLTKAYDPYRFVISNDGWEHTISDIITFHHYEQDADKLFSYYQDQEKALTEVWQSHWKGAFAQGYHYQGQPIIFSEFGGTAFKKNVDDKNWGYGEAVVNDKQYIERVCSLIKSLQNLPYLAGYCYTQVSDVEQEVNGLLDHDHEAKVDANQIKATQDLK